MAKDPAFLFYSQDWITGTLVMNFEDRGKYITILSLMHQQGRMSEETICFLVGSISVMLKSKFKIDENGLWYNVKLEEETEKRNLYTKSRHENGSKGGRPKKGQEKKKPYVKPKRNHMDNHMGNENENENENIINIDFDFFWDEYDKKVGDKEKLKRKWHSLSDSDRIKAMDHIAKYKVSQPDKKFRKDPGTYLNNKSFNDEIINSNGKQATTGSSKAFNGRNGGFAIIAGQLKDELQFFASGGTTDFGDEI